MKARLDRGFGNLPLLQQWGGFTSHHLVSMSSDHCPLLIENDPILDGVGRGSGRRRRRFMFEEMWIQDEECGAVVSNGWNSLSREKVAAKIARVSEELNVWGKEKFGKVRRTVRELRGALDELQRLPQSADVLEQRLEKECLLDQVLEREEIMWCQRSRVQWLTHGIGILSSFISFLSIVLR